MKSLKNSVPSHQFLLRANSQKFKACVLGSMYTLVACSLVWETGQNEIKWRNYNLYILPKKYFICNLCYNSDFLKFVLFIYYQFVVMHPRPPGRHIGIDS